MNRRRRNPSRGAREPMFWDRATLDISWSGAGPSGAALFQPDIFTAAATDSSFTLKRMKLLIESVLFVGIGGGTGIFMKMAFGIYMADKNALLRDPLLGTTDDQQADWLALWNDIAAIPQAPPATLIGQASAQRGRDTTMIDVKAQRRVNELQTVIFVMNGRTMGGTLPGTFSWNTQLTTSNLTSRSMRR